MDLFPLNTGADGSSFCNAAFAYGKDKGLVLGYFDGNTVTALWNYAQNFAMSDNSYGTTFGPSTPGLLNLVAGNTSPAMPSASSTKVVPNNLGPGTLVGDLDTTGDVCASGITVQLGGPNIGDLLNAKRVTWGAFMGGFDLTFRNANGTTGCARSSPASPSARLLITLRTTPSSNIKLQRRTRSIRVRSRLPKSVKPGRQTTSTTSTTSSQL